jgi:hypothetical protein
MIKFENLTYTESFTALVASGFQCSAFQVNMDGQPHYTFVISKDGKEHKATDNDRKAALVAAYQSYIEMTPEDAPAVPTAPVAAEEPEKEAPAEPAPAATADAQAEATLTLS